MEISYSFHISSRSHAVTTTGKLASVGKHNTRAYESSDYDRRQIDIVRGTDSVVNDVKEVYSREFDEALRVYNERQKRPERRIEDYLEHVSKSQNDVAVECIIQLGGSDFWEKIPKEDRQAMTHIFKDQIRALEELLPSFKIANAVIHYDEASPHMHVVGVPVAEGYTRGLERQCAKTKVFTQESLERCQDVLRARASRGMEMNPKLFKGVEMKAKEEGRNHDVPKFMLKALKEKEEALLKAQEGVRVAEFKKKHLESSLSALTGQIEGEKEELRALKEEREREVEVGKRVRASWERLEANMLDKDAFIEKYVEGHLPKEKVQNDGLYHFGGAEVVKASLRKEAEKAWEKSIRTEREELTQEVNRHRGRGR